jgi:predicted DNA binding CopG/RHH family protein
MAADASVQFRVTSELKARLRIVATHEQITESALLKQVLEVMLRTVMPGASHHIEEPEKPSRDTRLTVRFDPEDRILLRSKALARGMPSATYVSVLVRAHLRSVTPIPKEELLALKRSIAELRAVGNNLNQMAKAIHQGNTIAPRKEHVAAMLKVAEGLLDHFKALLAANERSWRQGHAEASN